MFPFNPKIQFAQYLKLIMSVISPQDLIKYINIARTNPTIFAKYVKAEMDTFINEEELPLKAYCHYQTNEGKQAWREAYQFLMHQKPMTPYYLNQGLTLAAEDHISDMVQNNFFGHEGSNGQTFPQRIERRCGKQYGASAEDIASDFKIYGRNHALQTVLSLVIDDGVPSRGHRQNLFSREFKVIGCGSRVQGERIITVIVFHSKNLPTINGSVASSMIPAKIEYDVEDIPKEQKFGWKQKDHSDLQGGKLKEKEWEVQGEAKNVKTDKGDRYVISKKTNTKTQTANGLTKSEKVIKIKYSDGTEEQERQETTTAAL